MQLTKYKLGDLIVQRREKNKDYDLPIRGVSREGFIKPKVEEADTSIYNVFYKNDFVFNPARMELNSIALNLELDKALCSSLYEVFYVKDENVVLPEFLNLHIKRDEFARHCDYIGLGSAREYCRFANIAEFDIKIPPIEVQREIVKADRQIKRRIRLNEQMIEKLEATAQALYRKMFVDGIDKGNLPEGWRKGTLGEMAEVSSGKTCLDKVDKKEPPYIYPVAGASGIIGYSSTYNYEEQVLTTGRVGTLGVVNKYKDRTYMADNVLVIKSQYYEYCYQILQQLDYNEITKGGVQSLITQTDLKAVEIIIPDTNSLKEYEDTVLNVFKMIETKHQENSMLSELQSLLLAKMGNLKQ